MLKPFDIDKNQSGSSVANLIHGDNNTHIIRMVVDRYFGGVDISELSWAVHIINAANETDVHIVNDVKIDDNQVTVDWIVHGVATSAVGKTQFELVGTKNDDSVAVWKSGIRVITITDDLNAVSTDTEDQISELNKLIIYVDGELNSVIAARDSANEAAENANTAANNANSAAEAANIAAKKANDAVNSYGTSISSSKTYVSSQLGCVPYQAVGGADYAQIIIYGQSLASGTETNVALTTEPVDGVYMIGNAAHHSPDHEVTTGLYPCINSGSESPVVAAAHHFARMWRRDRNPNQMFIANDIGLGGRSIERLSKGCTSYGYEYLYKDRFLDYLDDTKASVDAESKTVKCIAIVFMQGEYNYDGYNRGQGFENGTDATTDKDTYKAYLHQLKNDMQADIMAKYGQTDPPLFFVYQTGGYFISNSTSSINMAQQEMVAECDDAILLGAATPCPRFNGGHMSANGYRWQGEMIGKHMAATFLRGLGTNVLADRDITIKGNRVFIEYEVPCPPIVFDDYTVLAQNNYGFMVYMNESAVTISDVEIAGNTVILTCDRELGGVIEVKYAGNVPGYKYRGIGNLRDSDLYCSLYKYADDSAEVSSNGVAIDYRPLDENGNIIFGKNYPLRNWASHTYRRIIVDTVTATDFSPVISRSSASAGDTLTVSVTYVPTNANSGLGITWASSDDSKATVDAKGNVYVIGGENGDTVTITGTMENGVQKSVTFEIVVSENPYAGYYGYWDFSGGDASNTTTVRNLVTNTDDEILVGMDGTASGYLTTDGITLAKTSAIRIPVSDEMPSGVEIMIDMTLSADGYNDGSIKFSSFFAGVNGSTNVLGYEVEQYGTAWPSIRGNNVTGSSGETVIAWRFVTDEGGTSLGNSGTWWAASTVHQNVRIRINANGESEFAMKQATADDTTWRVWPMPHYAGDWHFLNIGGAIKSVCNALLIGNRASMDRACAGNVVHSVYIREYNA